MTLATVNSISTGAIQILAADLLVPKGTLGARENSPLVLGLAVSGADIAWRGCLIARYNERMKPKRRTLANGRSARWHRSSSIPMEVIRRFAGQVAERFQPVKIILFGSYAYGTPHADSDVDILVIMPARNQIDQAVKIRCQVPREFPMDLLVRTPATMKWRLAEGDLFHAEIVTKGKVLYEKGDKGMGRKGQRRLPNRGTHRVV